MADPQDTRRWVWRGIALGALLIGWVFITWQNHFHITAPVVIVCLAYLAVVATIYNLWRTGAAAVAESDDDGDSTWAKPAGALGELEREKRTLLKAIKEAEFDHQMGKLSKHDADEMIRGYRARAIAVIKEIDHIAMGAAGTPREQILREVRARLELDAKSKKPDAKREPKDKKDSKKATEAANGVAAAEPSAAKTAAAVEAAVAVRADAAATSEAGPPAVASESAASSDASVDAASAAADEMDADSTTAIESARSQNANANAKEASR